MRNRIIKIDTASSHWVFSSSQKKMYQRLSSTDIALFGVVFSLVFFSLLLFFYLYDRQQTTRADDEENSYASRFVEEPIDANDHTRLRNNPLFLRRFLQQYTEYYNIENAVSS